LLQPAMEIYLSHGSFATLVKHDSQRNGNNDAMFTQLLLMIL